VGKSGRTGLAQAVTALQKAAERLPPAAELPSETVFLSKDTPDAAPSGPPNPACGSGTPGDLNLSALLEDFCRRKENLDLYTQAYRRYCWPVASTGDYRIAPFHILATEGKVWNNETHLRHLDVIREYMTGADPVFMATNHLAVDLADETSVKAGVDWWIALTDSGGEGMVVKPLDFIARKNNRLLQPAVKCRGREYLRIIYGPEYTEPARLQRLRKRSLEKKRRLALAEFALGMEALERFVNREPFHRVHECVFAVLALENEAVDPRL
jgi:protein phosphatase